MGRVMREVKCQLCEKKFTTNSPNRKYCEECREIGARKSRKEWETKNNYKERQMLYARKRRSEARQERERLIDSCQKLEDEKRAAEHRSILKEKEDEFEKRVKDGDALANMTLCLRHGRSLEYWEYYKLYELQYAESKGIVSQRTVNGISINEPDFEDKVVNSIAMYGYVYTSM